MTKPESTGQRLLRVKRAAEYLSLSPALVRKLVQDGVLPVVIIGEGQVPWLIDVHDLDRWIAGHKQTLGE
jgi:excisionase family DNA binding protein